MAWCTSLALLAASPFAKELLELTVRLVPLILQVGNLAVQFRQRAVTPAATCQFEQDLADLLRQIGREVVAWVYNHLEPEDLLGLPPQLCFGGDGYRRRKKSLNRNLGTLFGTVALWRYRYEALERGLRSIFPLEIRLGVEAGRATPALAERVARGAAQHTQKAMRAALRQDHGVAWAVKTYRRVVASISAGMAEQRHAAQVPQVLAWLQQAWASPGRHRPVLSVGRDGIFVPLRQDSEYREGATATVSVLDRRGRRLGTVYLGRMPEPGQAALTRQLTDLIVAVLAGWDGVLPRLEYVTDGGYHQTAFYEQVLQKMAHPRRPGVRLAWTWVIDFYHASGYVSKLAEALFGAGREAQAWAHKMRRWLRDKVHGSYRVLHSAAALHARWELTATQERQYEAAYEYLRKRLAFLNYASYRKQGLAIGSGITEAACKVVFTQRLKQSGMKWSIAGGQVIIDLRVIQLSGIWPQVHAQYLAARPRLDLGSGEAIPQETLKKPA